jgi:E3 ubiquitin-protein ligase UBR1
MKKRTIQRVYQTLLQDADWHRFLLPLGGTDRMPTPTDDEGWVWRDEYGGEQSFSLSRVQKAMDLELVKNGQAPIRKQREGKLCGKTLKRYERTYTCK